MNKNIEELIKDIKPYYEQIEELQNQISALRASAECIEKEINRAKKNNLEKIFWNCIEKYDDIIKEEEHFYVIDKIGYKIIKKELDNYDKSYGTVCLTIVGLGLVKILETLDIAFIYGENKGGWSDIKVYKRRKNINEVNWEAICGEEE